MRLHYSGKLVVQQVHLQSRLVDWQQGQALVLMTVLVLQAAPQVGVALEVLARAGGSQLL